MKTLLSLFLLLPSLAFAQIQLSGKVLDFRSDAPLIGATIALQTDRNTGTQTDIDGSFSLVCQLGDTLIISYVGYKIRKYAAKDSMTIRLRSDDNLIKEVVVKAGKLIAREFATERIKKLDIYLNPNSKGDALRAIDALPASTNTEETANISLRGSSPTETGVFFNNVPLDDVVRFDQTNGVGQFSIFNTALVESVNVFPSNPPVEFGNSTSGVVAIYTDERVPKKSNSLSVNLVGVSGMIAREVNKKTGFFAFANWNNHHGLKLLNKKGLPDLNSFGTLDAGLYGIHKFSRKTSLKIFNFSLSEGYDFRIAEPNYTGNYVQSKLRNLTVANLVHKGLKTRWEWNQSFNVTNADYNFGNLDVNAREFNWYQALQGLYFTDKFSLKGGVSAKMNKTNSQGRFPKFSYAQSPTQPATTFDARDVLFLPEMFVFAKFNLSKNWTMGTGLRTLAKTDITPAYLTGQANINWRFSKGHSLTLAGGQYAKVISADNEIGRQGLLKSRQISVDYQWTSDNWTLQAAVYSKKNETNFRKNPIRGAEIFSSYQKNNFSASLSVASVNSLIDDGEISYASNYDLSYYLRAYAKYNIPNWCSVALIYKQREGRYYSPVVSSFFDENLAVHGPIYSAANEGERLPDYRLLDISFSKIIPVSFGSVITYFSINNALDFKNVRGYSYNVDYSQRTTDYFGRRVLFFGAVLQW